VQKKLNKKAQMLIFAIIFTFAIVGAASATNSSDNLTATNIDQASQIQDNSQSTNTNLSSNQSNNNNSIPDPQIWNGGVAVARTPYTAGQNTGTIQNAINAAQSGDTIMLENGVTFSGAGNTQITISKNLNFDVLDGGTATIDGSGYRWGFIISPGYTVTFNNIIFQNFYTSGSGAAIENDGGTLTLTNCVFLNNRAISNGGAIYNHYNGNLNVNTCQIYSNRANHGSGIYTTGTGTVSITNSQIYNNVNGDGVGIYVNSGNPTISGNNIYGNYWQGIYVNDGNAVISNNNIYNNGHNTEHGDGIWIDDGNAAITSNNIYSNYEDGIHVSGGNPAIHFNRIVGNGEYGLHMYEWFTTISATNNWWGHNTAPTSGYQSGRDYYNERGTATVNPWLVLGITANPYAIYNGDTSTVTADLNHNWNGGYTYNDVSGLGHVMNGLQINFSFTGAPLGTLSINPASTVNGAATTVFTADTVGTSHVNAALVLDPATIVHTAPNVAHTPCNIVITGLPTLTITKTANQANYKVGDNVVYTVHVTNTGQSTATNVVVTDTLPTGLTYVTSSNGGSYNIGTRIITWTLGSLTINSQFNPTITATVNAGTQGQTIPNTASTHCTQKPNDVTSQPVNIHVNNAVLTVTKSTTQANYNVGDTAVYNIDVLNNGPDAATNVIVTDTLPAGITYLSSTLGGVYDLPTRTITWNLPNLANGAHFLPSFTATVNTGTEGQSITNTASTHNEQNPTDVTSEPAVIHVNNAALTVTKTAAQANYNVGDTAVYNIDVLNNGPNTATNAVVTDTLPTGLTYLSSTLGGVYDAATRTVTWTVASLGNGVHFLATVSATVTADAAGKTVTNTLQAKDDQMVDPVSTTASIYVPSAALELTKTVNNDTPKVNDTVLYTLIVQNHGPDAATSVKVTDVVPTGGLKFVGVDSVNYGTYNPNTGVWTIGDLPANSTAKLVLRFTVTRAGTIENKAKVTSLTYDPNLYPTEATVTINVQKPITPVNPVVNAKTIAMKHTGVPIGGLILAVLMILGGFVLPRRKN
jgi:uncharacterized repeat protein (TIGR01451 family)